MRDKRGVIVEFIYAFLVGGAICVVGQLLLDFAKLTPAHVMAIFVVAGAILDGFGIYDKLIQFAGAGATVPITSFGHSLLHGAMEAAEKHGYLGIGMGMFKLTSVGISAAILFAFLAALIFKPKG
ncbi:stage V sporulation protein AE [Bacillus cereus group sp. BfR-BA-01380]|uniref:stage V sporulation protein AE n=1 Tax=Bacillus cereus group sp. BfR-BA-01380 TaxID=2920324 RepID=UPI002412B183